VAFKKATGEVAWKALDDKASYASASSSAGARNASRLPHAQRLGRTLTGDGSVFWRFGLVDKLSEKLDDAGAGRDLLIGSSVTYGSACLKLEVKDGKPGVSEVWKNEKLTCYISTPVALGKDTLYVVTGTLKNRRARRCAAST
jgi:hypothetical protein